MQNCMVLKLNLSISPFFLEIPPSGVQLKDLGTSTTGYVIQGRLSVGVVRGVQVLTKLFLEYILVKMLFQHAKLLFQEVKVIFQEVKMLFQEAL